MTLEDRLADTASHVPTDGFRFMSSWGVFRLVAIEAEGGEAQLAPPPEDFDGEFFARHERGG